MKNSSPKKSVLASIKIGERLRPLRRGKGKSLRWMAREIGISESFLHYLEKGQRCWTDALVAAYEKALAK